MDKFSVIIPTLWKVQDITLELLHTLINSEHVGEVILIDNSTNPPELYPHDKLIHIKEYKNTYYCPAINKGVKLSKFDKLCICNDDIVVGDINHHVINLINLEDFGMVGLFGFNELYKYDNRVKTILAQVTERDYGFACLYYIHKNNWIDIPDDLKIFGGDDYQFYRMGKPKLVLINPQVKGTVSATVHNTTNTQVIKEDLKNSKKYNSERETK